MLTRCLVLPATLIHARMSNESHLAPHPQTVHYIDGTVGVVAACAVMGTNKA